MIPGVEVSWYDPESGFGADILFYATHPSILGYCAEEMFTLDYVFPRAPREEWFAVWAYPYIGGDMGGGSFDESIVHRMLSWVDAIEVVNGGVVFRNPEMNQKATDLSRDYGTLCVAGSDAHEVAYAATAFLDIKTEVNTPKEFIAALKQGDYDIKIDPR